MYISVGLTDKELNIQISLSLSLSLSLAEKKPKTTGYDYAINHEVVHTVLTECQTSDCDVKCQNAFLKYCVFQFFLLYSFLRHPLLGPTKHYGTFTLIFD